MDVASQVESLSLNRQSYDAIYAERRTFLRYPADWIVSHGVV